MRASTRSDAAGRRALRALLRLPGRIAPVPGWFPLVVERLHPRLDDGRRPALVEVHGARFELDPDEYTQRRIYYRCLEENEVAFVRSFVRPGDAVVDVGANIGFFTIIAAGIVGPAGVVVAFEPTPVSFRSLTRNVELNGLDNVVLVRAAAGATEGTMTLGLDASSAAHGNRGGYTEGGSEGSFEAPVVRLDDFVARHLPGRRLRLVKIDVEGVEPKVLAGLASTLAEDPPGSFLVELGAASLAGHGYSEADVLEPLRAAGYTIHEIGTRGRLRPFHERKQSAQLRSGGGGGPLGSIHRSVESWRSLRNVVAIRAGLDD